VSTGEGSYGSNPQSYSARPRMAERGPIDGGGGLLSDYDTESMAIAVDFND